MELTKFQVTNFRSINDSGEITVDKATALVGRNESGKTNLLLALATLHPPGGRKPYNKVKDFPRGRRLEECNDDVTVVRTWWRLSPVQMERIKTILGEYFSEVIVGRNYGGDIWVKVDARASALSHQEIQSTLQSLHAVLLERISTLEDPHKANIQSAWTGVESAGVNVAAAIEDLRKRIAEASITLGEQEDLRLADLEAKAKHIAGFDAAYAQACGEIKNWVPVFIYVADFPSLLGHQNLDQFVQHRGQNPSLKDSEDNFEKMAKVAGFDPKKLNEIRNDHETRGQLLNRAGAVVTREIRRLWKDRALKVRFDIDGPFFNTLISDPNDAYDVEVNLDERSRGFKWFFSFYIIFSADTQNGSAKGAVLLLDEPGLHLHAMSQANLLHHLRTDYDNQILYTTHSPFMVPPDAINIVRTVNIDSELGTTVTDVPAGDSRTLFPLQAALGYHLSQTLFVGASNLIVEGVTDYWILSAVDTHFAGTGNRGLPDGLVITPAGGASKISYLAALMTAQELNVIVLLDDDRAGRETYKDLVVSKLVRDNAIMFVTEGFDPKPSEADVEDLLHPTVYTYLVDYTYKTELAGKKLSLNPQIPRIVKRYEEAFKEIGIEFHKTRPAREFMSRMGSLPEGVLPLASAQRFEAVFKGVRERYQRILAAGRAPFGLQRADQN